MRFRHAVPFILYALLPVMFVAGNLTLGPLLDGQNFHLPNLAEARRSMSQAPTWSLMRKTGNSIRVSLGQRLGWTIWGDTQPAMLFFNGELWASDGLRPPSNRVLVEKSIATITKYDQIARHDGWTVLIVPVPTKLSIYRDQIRWPLLEKNPLTRTPIDNDRADEIYDALLGGLREHHVATVDLRSVYRKYRSEHPGNLLFPLGESHWSGTGLRLATDATATHVAAITGIERSTFAPKYLDVEEVADLASAHDPLPAWLGPLAPMYKYDDRLIDGRQNPNDGLGNSRKPSLLVVAGTSYSAHFFLTHKDERVGFAKQLEDQLEACNVVDISVAGQGAFAPFEHFLQLAGSIESGFVAQHGLEPSSKVLVWEFPIRDLSFLADR
jgi:hypothetical protein